MKFVSRDDEEITSLKKWGQLGKPTSDHHWKPGRSAYELAADWIGRGASARLRALLEAGGLEAVELIEGTAEKRTYFDESPRGPRNHDLLGPGEICGCLDLGDGGLASLDAEAREPTQRRPLEARRSAR